MENVLFVNLNFIVNKPIIQQLFYFIYTILNMIENKKNFLIVKYIHNYPNHFLLNLLDLNFTFTFLKDNYKIHIFFDKDFDFDFNLLRVMYGNEDNNYDLTSYVYIHYYRKNILFIPETINLNEIICDPSQYNDKYLTIKYSLNNVIMEDLYPEVGGFLNNDILYDFKNNINKCFDYISYCNNKKYIPFNVLSTLFFKEEFYLYTQYFYNNRFTNLDLINIIYIDLERDKKTFHTSFLQHISKTDFIDVVNNFYNEEEINDKEWKEEEKNENIISLITEDIIENILNSVNYNIILERKYIQFIEKYISKSEKNIIISNSYENSIIDYLKNNNYTNYVLENEFEDNEEMNNLNTFLLARFCNNKFIGCYNDEEDKNSYNYLFRQLLDEKVDQYLITKN